MRPLATSEPGGDADWVSLSRKHAIDVDEQRQHLSIFGGKLTDCLNVGEEVAEIIGSMEVQMLYPDASWYGEPDEKMHQQFLHQARLMNLDDMTPASSSEPLTRRLWRRYGASAIDMLEDIRQDSDEAELLIESAEYLRCEIRHAAKMEMITKLEDFLRRRSKISQVLRHEKVIAAPGLRQACRIFFGDQADQKLDEYIAEYDGN